MTIDASTFDPIATLQGKAYPEGAVVVYTDNAALHEFETVTRLSNAEDDPEKVNEYEARRDELREQIKASAWTFHLRGYAPKVTKAINAEARALYKVPAGEDLMDPRHSEAFRHVNVRSLAESIVKIVAPEGEISKHFTKEDVEGYEDYLEYGEFLKLQEKHYELVFRAISFDAAVTPDFS